MTENVPTAGGYRRSLSGWHVAILMIAAAAPLSSMIGNVPGGLIFGNGAGLPGAFLAAAVLIGVLVVVYLALHRLLPDVSGFAGYVRAGVGPGTGAGVAYVTMLSYFAATLSYAVGVGYFGSLIAASHGVTIPWWLISVVAFAVIGTLGRRGAEVSGRVVMALVACEFALLIIMNICVIVQRGGAAFPVESFTPTEMLSGHPGLALMTGLTSFVGVEAGILYSRETRNARRAIPLALYGAIAAVAVFYIITSWIIIGGLGADSAVSSATKLQGDVIFGLAFQVGGNALLIPMQILFCGSVLASAIAMHNAASRYTADLAIDGHFPRRIGVLHSDSGAPQRASDIIALMGTVVVIAFAIARTNPYIGLGSSLVGVLTIGLFGVQVIVVIAAIQLFRRGKDRSVPVLVAAVVGGVGLAVSVGLMLMNFSVLTGTDSPWAVLPVALLLVALSAGPIVVRYRKVGAASDEIAGERPVSAPLL